MEKEQIEKIVEALRAAEMRQGCTDHHYFAEILYKELFPAPPEQVEAIAHAITFLKEEYLVPDCGGDLCFLATEGMENECEEPEYGAGHCIHREQCRIMNARALKREALIKRLSLISPSPLTLISDEEIRDAWQKAWDKDLNSTRDERLKAIAQRQLAHNQQEQGGKSVPDTGKEK
jgi:hypothetical protein